MAVQRTGDKFEVFGSDPLPHIVATSDSTNSLVHDAVCSFFDDVHRRLTAIDATNTVIEQAIHELFEGLNRLRLDSTPEQWQDFVRLGRTHPLLGVMHQDPFTRRAFHKPRGYAGDAVMLDYIYRRDDGGQLPEMTELGRHIFDYTTAAPASAAVLARREFISRRIDELTRSNAQMHLLTVAAGHLREASLAITARRRHFARWVALDADARSLGLVTQQYGSLGIECHHATFRVMLANRARLGQFDLIYSTGLFDYLVPSIGRRLTTGLFQMLRPGGTLIIGNFLPNIRDIGFMETYMDWQLIYRNRQQMLELTDDIPQAAIAELRLVAEENQNVIFLELVRS
jgi:hypothetical protein